MFRKTLTTSAVSAAIMVAGPALAQARGGGSGPNVNSNAHVNTQSQANVNSNVNAHANAAVNSQGPAQASINGIAHANSNSVLARGAVSASSLPGLTTGLTVQDSGGASVGTVSQVVTGSDGSIRAVIVTSPTGQTLRLPPSSLSISGSVVTTTSTTVGL